MNNSLTSYHFTFLVEMRSVGITLTRHSTVGDVEGPNMTDELKLRSIANFSIIVWNTMWINFQS